MNAMSISCAAWSSFLVDGLGFSSLQLGMINSVFSTSMSLLGLVVYKSCLASWPFPWVFGFVMMFNGLLSSLQICLVYGVNQQLGISDFAFSLGDTAFANFSMGIQFVPMFIMVICMCADGQEGCTFAIFATFNNVAISVATLLGTELVRIWDCSDNAMKEHEYAGLAKLVWLTTGLQFVPLLFLWLLPWNSEAHHAVVKSEHKSFWGGVTFLFLFFGSIITCFVMSVSLSV